MDKAAHAGLIAISLVGEDGSFTFPREMDPKRDIGRGVFVRGRLRIIEKVYGGRTVKLAGHPQHIGRPLL